MDIRENSVLDLGIKPRNLVFPVVRIWSLKNNRHIVKPRIIDKPDEKFLAERSFPDQFMAVDAGA